MQNNKLSGSLYRAASCPISHVFHPMRFPARSAAIFLNDNLKWLLQLSTKVRRPFAILFSQSWDHCKARDGIMICNTDKPNENFFRTAFQFGNHTTVGSTYRFLSKTLPEITLGQTPHLRQYCRTYIGF